MAKAVQVGLEVAKYREGGPGEYLDTVIEVGGSGRSVVAVRGD